jgi:hypothetical protein
MNIFFALCAILTGFSIPLLALLPSFVPAVGLLPFKAAHDRRVRRVQLGLIWLFVVFSLLVKLSGWSWAAAVLAVWFTFIALRLFPENIFIALDNPKRAIEGLGEGAPVIAVEINGETMAYPVELIVPHHIINDVIGGMPALASW